MECTAVFRHGHRATENLQKLPPPDVELAQWRLAPVLTGHRGVGGPVYQYLSYQKRKTSSGSPALKDKLGIW